MPSPAPAVRSGWQTWAWGATVAGLAAVLYLLTAARDIVVGDTGDLVTAALTLGVAHAPGYPLLTMLGHLLSWLPVGPLPFRVNLIAVLSDAAAVGVTFFTMTRLGVPRPAAIVGVLLFASTPLFWRWSLAAEAFPLNNLLVSIVIYGLVRWEAKPDEPRFLVVAAFAAGLALSNHMTIVLLGPAILFVLWKERRTLVRRPSIIAVCVGAVAVGLLPYVYIPWAAARDPFLSTGDVHSWADFVALVTRADYGSARLVAEAANAGGTFGQRLMALIASFTIAEGVLVALGAIVAYRQRRTYFWFTVIAFGVAGPAFMAYVNLDLGQPYGLFVLERFFLLSHVILGPLIGLGAAWILDWLRARVGLDERVAMAAVVLACSAAVAVSIARNYRLIDQHDNHIARLYAEDILTPLDPHTILMAGGDDVVFPITYVQAVEGLRRDVTPVWMSALRGPAWYRRQLRARDPNLAVPSERGSLSDPEHSMKAFVDANRARPIVLIGQPFDDTMKGNYFGFPRGLVIQLLPVGSPLFLDSLVHEYERLMPHYHVPAFGAIKPGTFETGILRRYAAPAQIVGTEYERAGDQAAAKGWYERALAIDPSFAQARDALARVSARTPRP